jgi:hypothetical protein
MGACCSTTFTDYLGTCPDDIIYVNTPLTVGTTYYWKITDKFGNEYTGSSTVTDATKLAIDASTLPEGLLSKHAGQMVIQVYRDEYYQILQPLLMSKYYEGVTFEVKHNTSDKSTLGAVKSDSWC